MTELNPEVHKPHRTSSQAIWLQRIINKLHIPNIKAINSTMVIPFVQIRTIYDNISIEVMYNTYRRNTYQGTPYIILSFENGKSIERSLQCSQSELIEKLQSDIDSNLNSGDKTNEDLNVIIELIKQIDIYSPHIINQGLPSSWREQRPRTIIMMREANTEYRLSIQDYSIVILTMLTDGPIYTCTSRDTIEIADPEIVSKLQEIIKSVWY